MNELNIKEELKKVGITENTRHHNYDYLYKTIVKVINDCCNQTIDLCTENFILDHDYCYGQKTGELSINEESVFETRGLIK
jgi:hypothetical protein